MVIGVDSLHERFASIPTKITKELAIELEKLAEELVRLMRMLVPKDTGALAESIGWTWGDAPAGSFSIGTFKGTKFGRIFITVYAGTRDKSLGDQDAYYARFIEFGTRKMRAQPFFFPAYRANRSRIRTRLRGAVRRGMKKS